MIALKVKNYFEFFVYKQKLIKTVLNIDDQIAMFDDVNKVSGILHQIYSEGNYASDMGVIRFC